MSFLKITFTIILILATIAGIFWNFPAMRRKRNRNKKFIEKYIHNYAILITEARTTDVGKYSFFKITTYEWRKMKSSRGENEIQKCLEVLKRQDLKNRELPITRGHFEEYLIALPEADYSMQACFTYVYSTHPKVDSTGQTKPINIGNVKLEKGCIYVLRLQQSYSYPHWVDKVYNFETIFLTAIQEEPELGFICNLTPILSKAKFSEK